MANSRKHPTAPGTAPPEITDHYPELRQRLLERRYEIWKQIDAERAELAAQQYRNAGIVGDVGDTSVIDTNADYFLTLADNDRRELLEIQDALERLQRGVLGVCESCEGPIALERLRRLPHARRCIDCQSSLEARQATAKPLHAPKL
jgi:DnaK suppressor protein